MDINDWRGIATILCLLAFAGVVWWAYSPARRKRFEDAAQIPFEDENETGQPGNDDEEKHQ